MKTNLKWTVLCLGMSLISSPLAIYGETTATSPSIPGQPLIFHHTKHCNPPLAELIVEILNKDQIKQLFAISNYGVRLSEDLLGQVGTTFLPTLPNQKSNLSSIYTTDMYDVIYYIYDEYVDHEDNISTHIALLVRKTLLALVQNTNKMLNDTVNNPSNLLFQQDYLLMQATVINEYKAGLNAILNKEQKKSLFKAEAVSSLEGLVSNLSLYIIETDNLVDGGIASQRNTVLARQQVVKNLIAFVQTNFALQSLSH